MCLRFGREGSKWPIDGTVIIERNFLAKAMLSEGLRGSYAGTL